MTRKVATPKWIYDGFLSVQTAEGSGLRRGLCTMATPQNIQSRLDPHTATRLQNQGVKFVIASGILGAGPTNNAEQIQANRPLMRALKEKGIRRVFYTQSIGTIFYEPVFAEMPEAVDWPQRSASGENPTYYCLWYRYIPCINNDGFIAYVKDVFQTVMKELDVDGIFTDNFGYYSYSCSCPHCQKKFREYLNRKYPTPEARKARFEFPTPLDFVVPPPFKNLGFNSRHTGIPEDNQILDPVAQEWIRFRCERIGEMARDLNACIKEVNPNAIFFVNYVYGGTPGINCSLYHGLWPELVYPHTDLISAEVAGPPAVNEKGVIQGRNLLMKVAKHFNVPLSTCTFDRPLAEFKRIFLAEGMAFNTAPVDLSGDIQRDDPPQWMRDYLDFYQAHRDLIGHAPTVADCAVLHNFETLSYCCTYPQESLVLCEQSLIQGNITVDIIFDKGVNDLEKYRCLFLANVLMLSRETVEKIAAYIQAGGAVIATEDTSTLNERMLPWKGEWLNPKKSHLLADLLGIEWPKSGVLTQKIGKGRIALIAEIKRSWDPNVQRDQADQTCAPSPLVHGSPSIGPAMPMLLGTPELALNHNEIMEAVDFALDQKRTLVLEGQGPLVGEVTQNKNGYFVHLLNWDESKPIKNINVKVRVPLDRKITEARLISPDRETPAQKINVVQKDGYVEFTVPSLLCYNIIVLKG
ncbi:MAG: beta-galactosidase trimerization domain-containing protein [Phycisphaerae bacterium]